MMKSLHVNAALMQRAIPRWVVNLLSVLMRGGTAASIAVLLLCALPSDATAQNRIQNPGFDNNPPPPAIDGCLKDLKVAVKCNPGGTYTVTLSGAGFSGSDITLTSPTSGITVTPPQQPGAATTTWTISGATASQTVLLTANETKVGGGSAPGTDQCCSAEIRIVMPECIDLKMGKEDTPHSGSGTWFNLWVTNVGSPITFPAGGLTVTDVIPSNMTVTFVVSPPGWTCAPTTIVGPGTITCTYNLAGSLATNAQIGTILVYYKTTGPGPFTNCATISISAAVGVDGNPSNDEACVTVTGTPEKIDLAIVKTGDTSPVPQVNGYAFHLAVTSVGTPFNGTNVITVTDVVPAGMTFNSAIGVNWTCIPQPASAGTTITCTYIGAGPTAPNQSLGTIDIVATALGAAPFPPFTNCAEVGLKPGSGHSDVNPPNDKSCVTVTKPPLVGCPPPMVPGAIPGQCSCPAGAVLKGKECVKPEACVLPMIAGPIPGVCMCPQGTVQQGKRCVPPLECRSPLVPNAAGTGCVCRAGLVRKGQTCVEQPRCNPPAILNRRGTCECPADMVAKGNSCIERERPRPQISPGDIIRNIPGGGRNNDNPRGGRDTDSPRGGGQSPTDFPAKR